jgi:hypothetical protein
MLRDFNVQTRIRWPLFGPQGWTQPARYARLYHVKGGLSNIMRPKMLRRFLRTTSRHTQLGLADPLYEGAETSGKKSRAMVYKDDRDRADRDSTSRLR